MNELSSLAMAVSTLATLTQSFSDADMEQPWAWGPHKEGVRFALIGTYHELQELAVKLHAERGTNRTAVHHLLAQYNTAYQDLQAILIGLPDDLYETQPAAGEWPVRIVLGHIADAQRSFFTLIHYALRCLRKNTKLPPTLPDGEVERVTGPRDKFYELINKGSISDLRADFAALHQRALHEFATITDDELQNAQSLWWEGTPYNLYHRLIRCDAHLRQHTIQAEKTLAALDHRPSEARQWLRLVYHALADVEGACIGLPKLGQAVQVELASAITARAQEAAYLVKGAHEVITAVTDNDLPTLTQLLQNNPALANARAQSGLSALMTSIYYGKHEAVQALRDAGATLNMHEAAAIGDLERAQELAGRWNGYINQVARDGFTPLQLACFFNCEALALWLMEQGADIHAVAQNPQRIQPLHAVVTNGNLTIAQALLDRGADVNARQANDFTPLHTAADNGDEALAQLLLAHGADRAAADGNGRTPYDLAQAKGHAAILPLLAIP